MGIWQAISLGIALGADSFSVSVGIGMNRVGIKRVIKLSLLFSLLQGILLVFGTYLAELVDWLIHKLTTTGGMSLQFFRVDPSVLCAEIHFVISVLGASVLAALGVNMLRNYFGEGEGETVFYTGRWGLILLALGVSVDAMTAGLGLGFVTIADLPVLTTTVTAVIWVMAFFGLTMGRRIGRLIGRRAEMIGGILLIAIAAHFFLQIFR